jgi:hypothetical protein
MAHCTASTTLENSAITASPQVLTVRPSCRPTSASIAARYCRSVPMVRVSSLSISRT